MSTNISAILPPRYRPVENAAMYGGYGSVVPVLDSYLGRSVLFKSMQDPANNAQLLNEIQHLSQARSRHVVEIYDVVTDKSGNVAGIIIEQLTGRDYLEFYKEAVQNPAGYVRVLYQISTALRDLHAAGVVHRDLKLDNLRSSASGIVKLFDFGISSPGAGYYTHNNRGTFVYAAPELYISGAAVGFPMDVYAFGICAWALASSNFPTALLERPPQTVTRCPSINTVFSGVLPSRIAELIDRSLSPIPNYRPTADELSKEFAKHLTRGLHKGLFIRSNSTVYELSNAKNNVGLKIGNIGELKVSYDGLEFRVTEVTGDVYVNNWPAAVGMQLHDACVLTFGAESLMWNREWVTFFSSHPEVIL